MNFENKASTSKPVGFMQRCPAADFVIHTDDVSDDMADDMRIMSFATDDVADDMRMTYVIRRQFPAKSHTTTSSACCPHVVHHIVCHVVRSNISPAS